MIMIFARIFTVYACLIAALRLMGKRQLSEFQPFELAVTMLMADMASGPLTDPNQPLFHFLISIVLLAFLQGALSYLTMKSPRLRSAVCGRAVSVVERGVINQEMVREMMLSVDDLIRILRSAGSPPLEEISFAVAETNGEVNIGVGDEDMPITLIENGKLTEAALKHKKELSEKLEAAKLTPKDIFWAYVRKGRIALIQFDKGEKGGN